MSILDRVKNELVYKNISFKQDMLCDLVTKSNDFFKDLKQSGCITEREQILISVTNTKRSPT